MIRDEHGFYGDPDADWQGFRSRYEPTLHGNDSVVHMLLGVSGGIYFTPDVAESVAASLVAAAVEARAARE